MLLRSGREPGILIRTREGRITFWSDELQQRYGFSAAEALGQVAHQLLRAIHWQTPDEIDAALAASAEWRGGLIVHRADDQPVIVANHWQLHRGKDGLGSFVTEVHGDIVTPGTGAGHEMADIVATLAQEFSQPLTALSGFIGGMKRAAQPAWPDLGQLDGGLSGAASQLERMSDLIARLRALGHALRDPRLRELHGRLSSAASEAEHLAGTANKLRTATSALFHQTASARQQRAFTLQTIQVYRRRLDSRRSPRLDGQAEHLLTQLLREEEAKLASLEDSGSEEGCWGQ